MRTWRIAILLSNNLRQKQSLRGPSPQHIWLRIERLGFAQQTPFKLPSLLPTGIPFERDFRTKIQSPEPHLGPDNSITALSRAGHNYVTYGAGKYAGAR